MAVEQWHKMNLLMNLEFLTYDSTNISLMDQTGFNKGKSTGPPVDQ